MGKIHSIETMGTLDGPGIRIIIYFQGCPLRCLYCHNPDTWDLKAGMEMTVEEVVLKIKRYKTYFGETGGVTFSGGEPLMQPEFLIECLEKCQQEGIHTALDTSGVGKGFYDEVLKYTDLVILDIKHQDEKMYQHITKRPISEYYRFKAAINKANQKVWLKHVVVPGLTDDGEHIVKLKEEIFSFDHIEKIELLPYHTMGVNKYETMNLLYPLKGVADMETEKIQRLQEMLLKCDLSL